MRTSFFLLLAAAAICAVASSVVSSESKQGYDDPVPVPDNAPKVQQFGRWAVAEHDKKANDKVKFNRVVSGEVSFLDPPLIGLKYHLVIDASDGSGQQRKYEAMLGEQWIGRVILISFKLAA